MAETSPLPAAFSQLGEPLPGELSDGQLVEASLARFSTADGQALLLELEQAPNDGPATVSPRRRGVVVMLALAAVLVLAFSVWGGGLDLLRGAIDGSTYGSAASMVADQDAPEHAAQPGVSPTKTQSVPTKARKVIPLKQAPPESQVDPEQMDSEATTDGQADEQPQAPTTSPMDKATQQPSASADELLAQAQALLAKGQTSRARRAYRSLIEYYPGSREARASRVTLGRLALTAGHPRKALRWFERYLAGGVGPLAEEAEVGRVQALGKLGRAEAEQQAIEAFLADPSRAKSLYRGRLGRRLKQLKTEPAPGEELP